MWSELLFCSGFVDLLILGAVCVVWVDVRQRIRWVDGFREFFV